MMEAMTKTTTETTTEPQSGRRWWPAVPVRLRITAAVLVLSGLAMVGAGVVVFLVESARIDRITNASIEQEVAEFELLVERGDPVTGKPFTSPENLFKSTLARNVANEGEFIFASWRSVGQPKFIGDRSYVPIVNDPVFRNRVASMQAAGGFGMIELAGSEFRFAVKAVTDQRAAADDGVVVFAYDMSVQRGDLRDLIRTYAIVAAGALTVLALAAFLIAGRLLRPLRELRSTAQEISVGDLTRRIEVSGNDDLTDLTVTFNSMLDRLDGAFATQRQFLDDVGHELKTRITIVQGHLELMDVTDVDEVGSTRDLVLDEMDRMSRLVGELVLLAKTRRPDFLRLETSDVHGLTTAVYEKAQALGSRQWILDGTADGRATLDPQRVTQAILQLASNAVRHTDEGDVVAIGSTYYGGAVAFWVRDTGDGIDQADQARIFERFRRGTAEGDGSGLGLAIVRGIAQAHGGRIEVHSDVGRGSRFTITMPREQPWATGS